MIKIFSTDKVRELDKYTIQNEPISSIDLVERAATVFTSEFCRRYSKQTRIIVFAGQGNNGADALAIARMLTDAGYRVSSSKCHTLSNRKPLSSIWKQSLSPLPFAMVSHTDWLSWL